MAPAAPQDELVPLGRAVLRALELLEKVQSPQAAAVSFRERARDREDDGLEVVVRGVLDELDVQELDVHERPARALALNADERATLEARPANALDAREGAHERRSHPASRLAHDAHEVSGARDHEKSPD